MLSIIGLDVWIEAYMYLPCTWHFATADRRNAIIMVLTRKKDSCSNYGEFRISKVRISEVSLNLQCISMQSF
jgi:hypothetical protein